MRTAHAAASAMHSTYVLLMIAVGQRLYSYE
jgi:hypothetical protein